MKIFFKILTLSALLVCGSAVVWANDDEATAMENEAAPKVEKAPCQADASLC